MNTESQAADQIVSMSLHGMDFLVRLAGDGAKNLIVLLAALMKDNIHVKGRTTLNRMLRDGKEIKVFQIRNDQIKDFAAESKRIGLLFTAIKDKSGVENCDILIRAEDASKVNRIIERMNLTKVDIATFKTTENAQPEVTREAENPMQARRVSSELAVPNPSESLSLNSKTINALSEGGKPRPSVYQQIDIITQKRAQQRKMPVPARKPRSRGR